MKTPNPLLCIFTTLLWIGGCGDSSRQEPILRSEFKTHFSLISDGNTGSARVRLRQYMDANGESPQALFLMGLSYHHEKQYAHAVQWLDRAAALGNADTAYPPTWHFLGWSHFYIGNLAASEDSFLHYLKMDPEEGDSLFGLGLLAMEEGEPEEAMDLFKRSIVSQPDRPEGRAKALARLADVLTEQDKWSEAVPLYREALELNPDLYEAWYHLATTFRRLNKTDESEVAMVMFVQTQQRVRPDLNTTRFAE